MADVVPGSLEDLQKQLAEVQDEISLMTGSVNFSMGGMTVDENASYDRLVNQKADLQWSISNIKSGGGVDDNCGAAAMATE